MGENRGCYSSIPLASKLDRLDSMVKYIEGKQDLSRLRSHGLVSKVKRKCKPLEMAVSGVRSRGSLLDRVACLEYRLVQLCLEIESRNISLSKIEKSWGLTASSHGSEREIHCSLPTFNHCLQTSRSEF